MMINTFHEASEGNRFAQYARRFLNTVTDFSVWRVTILSFRHCYFCCYSFFYVTFLRSDFSKDVGFVYKQKNTDDSWYNWSANSTTKTTTRSLPNKKKEKPHPVIHKTEFPWERSVRINPDSAGNNVKNYLNVPNGRHCRTVRSFWKKWSKFVFSYRRSLHDNTVTL